MGKVKTGLRIALVAGMLSIPIVWAQPAAAVIGPMDCTAAGTVIVADDPITGLSTWTISGRGSCLGNGQGTHFVDFTGTGTSLGLGKCSNSGVVSDLKIAVTGTLLNTSTGMTHPLLQSWNAGVTTFPVAVPFQIGDGAGAGAITTRIFGNCPPAGTPTAYFVFSFGG